MPTTQGTEHGGGAQSNSRGEGTLQVYHDHLLRNPGTTEFRPLDLFLQQQHVEKKEYPMGELSNEYIQGAS